MVLLTKSDKLNKTEAAKALSIVKLQAGGGDVKLFSALKKQGVEEVGIHLWNWAHPPEKPVKPPRLVVDDDQDSDSPNNDDADDGGETRGH